uniref:RING-type E3 ubiquitin transferase n=1 Tax=Pyxicephalus adspersus TaxID=30357 RepID=A0AAV3A5Y7_PYXAD|nr:TPA: hypothetical protein GDO54_016927 [Pyxicephalus adspersus]
MPARRGRSRHNIIAGPIAHRTRSRYTLQGNVSEHQLPERPTRRGRVNTNSSQRDPSRSPVGRRDEFLPEDRNSQTPPANNQQSEDQPGCSICLLQYEPEEQTEQLACAHIFHPDCINTWLRIRRTCPNCREAVPLIIRDTGIEGMWRVIIWCDELEEEIAFLAPAEIIEPRPLISVFIEDGEYYMDYEQILPI